MKSILSLLTLLSLTTTQASELYAYTCKEKSNSSSEAIYVVRIQETKDLTKALRNYRSVDQAAAVKISLNLEVNNGSIYTNLKTFEAIATSEDVFYTISSVKKNGFSFYLYLDEYDQAGMVLTNADGKKERINLICE